MNIDNIKSILLVVFSCLSMTVASQSQQLVITGNVSSDLEGEIIGAHVTEVDANGRIVNATITDFSGNFSLSIKSVNNKLKVSFVGYDPVEVSIKDKRRFNIKMKENAVLDEQRKQCIRTEHWQYLNERYRVRCNILACVILKICQ